MANESSNSPHGRGADVGRASLRQALSQHPSLARFPWSFSISIRSPLAGFSRRIHSLILFLDSLADPLARFALGSVGSLADSLA